MIIFFYICDTFHCKNVKESQRLVAQLFRALFQYAKIVSLIPMSGHVQEIANEHLNKWNNKLVSFFLFLHLFKIKIVKEKSTKFLKNLLLNY